MVESKSVSWDAIDVDTPTAVQGCAEGILETIDWTKLGLDRSKFTGADLMDCAVPTILYATVIAYDKDKLANGPTTIADVFDQKFPKRGLQKNPFVNLEWALIADGVAVKDVCNKVLNTPAGVDRAFKKLDTIKKDVVWWEAGAQPPQLLADGQVVMTSARRRKHPSPAGATSYSPACKRRGGDPCPPNIRARKGVRNLFPASHAA